MDKQAFKQRMQNLKSYRENNPGKGYWDWKVEAFADGGVNDNLIGSYSNHTGTPTMYVPVTKEYEAVPEGFGEIANVHTPEVTITPQSNISLVEAVDKGRRNAFEYIKEAASYTPIVGDAMGASDAVYQATQGNYSEAALAAGLMLLPNFIKKPLKRVGKLLKKNKKIISELQLDDVRNWTDSDWDSNYNQAINDGDKDKVQRIRDLHFMSKAPNNNISIRNGKPTTWFHGSPYAGHTTFNSSVFNNTIGGESALGREKGNFFTTDLNAAKNYATSPSAKSEFSEYTKPKNAKEKILDAIGLYEPKYIHPVDRIPEDLGIDVKNMHNYEVSPLQLMDMSDFSNSKVYQSNKIYPTYINPGKTYTVDFEGNPWSQSPVKFPSKYYSRETYPDVDLVPSKNYPEGHFVEKRNTSNLSKDLDELKQELNSLDLPYNNVYYDGSGNESLYGKYRGWNSKLEPKNLISEYPNYRTRPGYSYSIFEHKYPNTTNGAVQYGASENFNTIHITNVVDANTGHYENYPIEDLIPLSSNQIKLANPITYDSSGKIIPISKRDNFTNPDIRYGLIPLIGFSALNYNDNSSAKEYKNRKYSEGGQTGDPEKERFYQATGRSSSGRPLEEGLKPVFSLEDAANMTPIGDAISAKDAYDAVKNRDWLGAGLAAVTMIPFVPTTVRNFRKKYKGITPKREIPTVNKKAIDNAIDEAKNYRDSRIKLYQQAIEDRNASYERLIENEDALRRAVNFDKKYGTNYVKTYTKQLQNYAKSKNSPDLMQIGIKPMGANGSFDPNIPDYVFINSDYVKNGKLQPGLISHEKSHYDNQKAGALSLPIFDNRFVDTKKTKTMYPKTYDWIQRYLHNFEETKSHMNEFRTNMINKNLLKPDSKVGLKQIKDLIFNSDNDNMKKLFNTYKSKRQFVKDFNSVPITSIGDNKTLV